MITENMFINTYHGLKDIGSNKKNSLSITVKNAFNSTLKI